MSVINWGRQDIIDEKAHPLICVGGKTVNTSVERTHHATWRSRVRVTVRLREQIALLQLAAQPPVVVVGAL